MAKTQPPKKVILTKYRLVFIIAGALILVLLLSLGLSLASKPIGTYDECVAAGGTVQESYPAVCVTGGKQFKQPLTNKQTFEGTIVCMPHKNTDGPQTLECASGLKTGDGTYYSLKTTDTQHELASKAGSSQKVRIIGAITAEPDSVYQSSGLLNVESYELIH